jgi:DivIVA domain-containing protein
MYWLQLVVIVALLAAVGWLAIGGGGHMSEPMPDRPDLALPRDSMLARTDVDRVRFSVGARGYRMDEVDDVLDRLAREIQVREDRIAVLEGRAPESAEPEQNEYDLDAASESGSEPAAESVPVAESGEAADSGSAREASAAESAESKTRSNDDATAPVQAPAENEQAPE